MAAAIVGFFLPNGLNRRGGGGGGGGASKGQHFFGMDKVPEKKCNFLNICHTLVKFCCTKESIRGLFLHSIFANGETFPKFCPPLSFFFFFKWSRSTPIWGPLSISDSFNTLSSSSPGCDYLEQFNNRVDILERCGASLGEDPGTMHKVFEHDGIDLLTTDEDEFP